MKQNGSDGVNKEQAISYQQFVLDFLLFAALAGKEINDEFPQDYWNRMELMLEYIDCMLDRAGNYPMIGDADDGYVTSLSMEERFCPFKSLLATGAIIFNRGDFKRKARFLDDKTRSILGADADKRYEQIEFNSTVATKKREFIEGGYYIAGHKIDEQDEVRLIIDAGPLGYESIAAHGHADALSMYLAIHGKEFLIDPGTYAYHTEKRWRNHFRGTAAHNTACVDNLDQSVIGGNFLWVQHAKCECQSWQPDDLTDHFSGVHHG